MDHAAAREFALEWESNWNDKDLEALLAHFSDDVLFTSPVAAQIVPASGGVLRGKQALRDYWTEGLRRIPELRFEVASVYSGVDTLVINYRNHVGSLVCEVLLFEAGRVVQGHGTYLRDDAADASGVGSPDSQ